MSTMLQLTPDARLFILDNEGLVFVEGTEKLYTLNTTATFIWCHLEEGRGESEIVDALADTFSLNNDTARRFATDIVAEWRKLGLLTGGDDDEASEIDFVTALGRLLTDATLRERFVNNPRETAKQLRISAGDFDAVTALEPVGLQAQAEVLLAKRLRKRSRSLPKPSESSCAVPAAQQSLPAMSFAVERSLRLLNTNLRLRFSSTDQERTVRPLLEHLEISSMESPDVVLDIMEESHDQVIFEDGIPLGRCMALDQLAPLVKWHMVHFAVTRHDYFLDLHAGVVGDGKQCLLLSGRSGAGKSLLTAALVHAGFRYHSDEIALLEEPDLHVRSVPVSLSVKQSGWEIAGCFFPELHDQPIHYRADGMVVRYIPPDRETFSVADQAAYPVGWIIFPHYKPEAMTILRPIRAPDALRRLTNECLAIPNRLTTDQVARLVQWIQTVPCFELSHSSLPDAVKLIQNLTRDGINATA